MIHRQDRDSVTLLSIEKGKANALDIELLGALRTAVTELEDQTGALVLTGAGKMFSAGLDLNRLVEGGPDYILELVEVLDHLLDALIRSRIPSVAAINGHAIAGGFILASACDRRVMARGSGRLGLTEMALGVPFPPLALELVRSVLGDARARQVVLSADLYSVEEAARLGFADELTEPETLIDRAVELAAGLARIPRSTFALTKRQLFEPLYRNLRGLGDEFVDRSRQQWIASQTVESMRRFVAERIG